MVLRGSLLKEQGGAQVEGEWLNYALILTLEQNEGNSNDEDLEVDRFLWFLEALNQKRLTWAK